MISTDVKQREKMLLCTVTACPLGRTMGTVKEVCAELPQLEFEVIYTDLQHEITNRFCITELLSVQFDGNAGGFQCV